MTEVAKPFIADSSKKLPLEYRHSSDKVCGHFRQDGLDVLLYKPTQKRFPNIPDYAILADFDFKPAGSWSPDRSNTSVNLLKGLKAFSSFFTAIEDREMPTPDYLHGTTTKEMANLAKRLGFSVTKIEPKFGKPNYEVFARSDIVQKKLSELMNQGVKTLLQRRISQ